MPASLSSQIFLNKGKIYFEINLSGFNESCNKFICLRLIKRTRRASQECATIKIITMTNVQCLAGSYHIGIV